MPAVAGLRAGPAPRKAHVECGVWPPGRQAVLLGGGGGLGLPGLRGRRSPPGEWCPSLGLTPALQLGGPLLPPHLGRVGELGCPGPGPEHGGRSQGSGWTAEVRSSRAGVWGDLPLDSPYHKTRFGPASQSPWWDSPERVGIRSPKSLVRHWGPLFRERGQVWGESTAWMDLEEDQALWGDEQQGRGPGRLWPRVGGRREPRFLEGDQRSYPGLHMAKGGCCRHWPHPDCFL